MANAIFQEFKLFCPICNVTFTQPVFVHKVPKNFSIEKYLHIMVENHNHQAYQAAQAHKKDAVPDEQDGEKGA
jgi:hypothetical protein